MPIFFYLLIFLTGCHSSSSSSDARLRKLNLKGEYVYRLSDEHFFKWTPPAKRTLPTYSWEIKEVRGMPLITKEFFRCKGSRSNPVVTLEKEEILYLRDCSGSHSLPLKEGKEYIYPALISLLNFIQEKAGKKVLITTGHRCLQHNSYCDPSPKNWSSKHLIGAEVDFYVEGLEEQPDQIVQLLQNYYLEKEPFAHDPTFENFQRYEKEGLNVSTPPWYNKEIFIKLYLPDEGRDRDNGHPHPYIGIQLRYDRDLKQPVTFDPKQAQNYLRQ